MKRFYLSILIVCLTLIEESISHPKLRHSQETNIKCSKCPPGWGVLRVCTAQSNTICEKCELGKTYSPHYTYRSSCYTCSKCGVGLYEAHKCSLTRDTICDDCTRFLFEPNKRKNNDFTEKCSYMYLH